MKTLIVAKTHMGQGACVGGLTITGQNVRLLQPGPYAPQPKDTPYEVGEVWELEMAEAQVIDPPHVEDAIVVRGRKLYTADNLPQRILKLAHPWQGHPANLFEGFLQLVPNGSSYISPSTRLPPMSVGFWQPDKPLYYESLGHKIRYVYRDDDGYTFPLPYVGYAPVVREIPQGMLLRVSLARWWKPVDDENGEARCYLQLSGWFGEELVGTEGSVGELDKLEVEPPDDPFTDEDWERMMGDAAAPTLIIKPQPANPTQIEPQAYHHLKTIFGYDSFRSLQLEIIKQVCAGQDTLVIMPTGGGKSLCYQLPALILDGLTVVVSPLISLMKDQVDQLREVGVAAAYLNSSLPLREYDAIMQQVYRRELKLLYLAPETLVKSDIIALLQRVPVAAFVVDEAHCISQWGHDFRPEYRQILDVRRHFPHAVTLALTATATPRVQQDIRQTLGLRSDQAFIASFNRENLFLSVAPKTNPMQQMLDFLAAHQGQSGIVYCASRRQVDELTTFLSGKGYNVRPYHAGLSNEERNANQTAFIRDDVPLMVATIAFGLGIDKPNIRFVLHFDLPENLEGYYQQIGRAGRDGQPSDCLLLFSRGDMGKIGHFIREKAPHEQKGAWERLDTMARFAETITCRRVPLLAYFGEVAAAETCEGCDNCAAATPIPQVDITLPAQKFLSCVKRTGELFGSNHIIDVLRGSKAKGVLDRKHDQLSTYGIGLEFSKKQWQHLADQFIRLGLLIQDAQYGSLKLTTEGYAAMKGQPVLGTMAEETQREWVRSGSEPPPYDVALFEQLRQKRKELADEANLPPYTIFHDQTLQEMATYFPQSEAALLTIYGVGEAKLDKYGATFLEIIRAYCRANGIKEQVRLAAASRPKPKIGTRAFQVVEMLNEGNTVDEIAAACHIHPRTVIKHLFTGHEAGYKLNPDGLRRYCQLPPEQQETVLQAFATLGPNFLRPVYDHFQETITWDDLHILRLIYLISL